MSKVQIDPDRLSYEAIREYAERVGFHHGIYTADGRAELEPLVRELGGELDYSSSVESLRVEDAGAFTIFLPPMTSMRRDRFTIAHELGHYFLHYLLPGHSGAHGFGRGERNRRETQANVFASSLLMPADAFTAAYNACEGNHWELASRFDVSPAAAGVRCQVLGLE